ncbi:unnamed protein product [Lepeophtheirus salmonis]|uniref:(salmon louse) hypothetical protein n=1 Tax=Lepeophtheirus salmonis TaxID=72036 RepID=A0A7R8D5Q8_LEPSM|nr:unnamed protein product [Lepeophtheirus salmonis]CAF3034093.1 unnamed protein product [Lepeophtheirus salmonis]
MTFRLPHQTPIGSLDLTDQVLCMTGIESDGFLIILLGDAEGLKSSPLRKDEICAISSFLHLLILCSMSRSCYYQDEIPYTKLVPPMHELKDAVILLPRPKSLFDQLHEHQKTEGPLVITVGTGVLFQKHTFPSTLSEWDLAKNVVSTVKSGFFRVFCPDGRFTAVSDLQHRIQLFDNELGRLLQVWKGYHHARFAWIFSEETAKSPPQGFPSSMWMTPEFVKFKDGNKFINLVTGEIFSFIVPMASVHDPLQGIDKFKRTLNKFYRLNNEEDTDRYLKELLYLIRSAGSQHQQCSLLFRTTSECQHYNSTRLVSLLSAKNFFYHSQMTHSNLGIMKLWIAFICERENELNEDFIRVSSLIRTFLLMREQFSNLTQIYDMKGNTFDEVFNKGNGMLPSIVVSWFISAELKLDIAEEFRLKTIHLFPQSFSQETFYSHYSWSLFAYQNNAYIKNFSSMNDIKTILTDKIMTPIFLKHRLSAILWSNFVQGYIRVLLKLFKGSGFREIAPNEIELEDSQNIELIKYDDVSFVEQPFIGDFINTFTRSEDSCGNFKIDCNPLSLFERRDLDEIIFPNDDKQSSRSFSIGFQILRGFSGEMEKYRTAFLEKTSFRLVDLIEIGDGDQMKKDEFELWVTKYYTLAGYWNMRSKSKIYIMKELYKAGYDSAGREMFEPSSFEQEELNELNSTKPELRNKLAYCEVFTDDFVDVPIRKTRDLFSLICSVDDDEEMLDCLSIVRSIQEANLE